jgi:hypothetical protein
MKMKNILFSILFVFVWTGLKAQNYDLILGGTISDVELYTKYYLAPLERGLGHADAAGMINFTSSKHKIAITLGMDLSVALTPSDQRSFDVNAIGLQLMEASDPANSMAQSITGSAESIGLQTKQTYYRPTIYYPFYEEVPLSEFDSPEGSGYSFVPLPRFSAGLYGYGSHINFWFLPTVHPADDISFGSYGFSLQHNLSTFIKTMEKWPVQLAIAGGYHYSKMTEHLSIEPDETKIGLELSPDNGPYDNQEALVEVSSVPLQLIVYRDFNGLTVFGGPGYTFTSSDFALTGNYPIYVKNPTNNFKINVKDVVDPFAYSRSDNSFRFDIGLNYQIGFVKIKASYTIAKYQTFYFGLGFVIL